MLVIVESLSINVAVRHATEDTLQTPNQASVL